LPELYILLFTVYPAATGGAMLARLPDWQPAEAAANMLF